MIFGSTLSLYLDLDRTSGCDFEAELWLGLGGRGPESSWSLFMKLLKQMIIFTTAISDGFSGDWGALWKTHIVRDVPFHKLLAI